ncbi:class I SAM-dependent methyltransferase [Effusibacillus dendaii]|uniref:Methyltransferase type 11 domain-containing protein n=1 Tax=Effusibacillus dendaii TaxID=2743772 RepID=A0A7I8DCE9_9BACL|nr:class I SAM-dependent methyltransferase [Effusibacillus dendaii]BCJ87828.1 hypothetical protein skT53_28130 [Effusibacillus dendaii]
MRSEIIKANIEVHTIMASSYNNEPHFRPENKSKVRDMLLKIRERGGSKLLDIGCGTGFIIDLAKDLFTEIHGVDVTQAMLDQVDISNGYITLHNTPAEKLPFDDNFFDVVTAYSFIHHVEDYRVILKEAFRVLKPGGVFYIDLEPNKMFWQAISELEANIQIKEENLSDIVKREISSVLHTDSVVEQEFGIDKDTFNKAEYIKSILGGIDPYEFENECFKTGYRECEVSFQWFLGQGAVMHGQSFEAAQSIAEYLNKISPLANHLFKYLRFILVK